MAGAHRWLWLVALCACADDEGSGVGGGGPACDSGMLQCGDACLDANDDASCGACDVMCDEQHVCADQSCEARCSSGGLYCDGACTDPFADPNHCGDCGVTCFEGQICQVGSCMCLMGGSDCGSFCADTQSDAAHCGGCGEPCPGRYDVCLAGECVQDCAAFALSDCDGACVDLASDPDHCGRCDFDCNLGYDCIASMCGCQQPLCGLCGFGDIAAVPASLNGITTGLSHIDPTCAGSGAPEVSHRFTAPAAGTFAFRTAGSSFNTALHLYDTAQCALVDCNNDSFSPQSLAFAELAVGEQVLVVIDGSTMGQFGNYQLEVVDVGCPAVDVGSAAPQAIFGHTSMGAAFFVGSCGGPGVERTFQFTAPQAGSYTIDTIGSAIDTVLYVRDAGCTGAELACDDDGAGGDLSTLTVVLAQGQSVVIVADGYFASGAYVVNISGPS